MAEQTENTPPPAPDEAGKKKFALDQQSNLNAPREEESGKLFKQGTEGLQKSTKSGDVGGGLAAVAMIFAALFAFRRERQEAAKTSNTAPDTGGMDARTVDHPEQELEKTRTSITNGQSEEKTLQDQEAKLKTDLEALQKAGTPNVEAQQKLQTELTTVQNQRIKITGSRAQMQARVTALTMECGRRDRLVQDMNKSIQANPNRVGESLQRTGNRVTITLRDGRPLTAADTKRMQEIQEQFGSYGLQISGNPTSLTVPAMFWSEWTAGQANVGRGARMSILSFLRGPEPVVPQPEAKTKQQQLAKNTPPSPLNNLPPQPPAKQKLDKAGTNNPDMKAKTDAQELEKKTKTNVPLPPYSPEEFMKKRESENTSKVLEDLINGTGDVQTVVRIDELKDATDKLYKVTSDEQWKASGEENSLGWAQVNADRELVVAPALYPKQIAEKQKAATEAKQKYEKAQGETKRLTARASRLMALSKETYNEKQRRDTIVGNYMNRTPEGGVRLEFNATAENILAFRELLNMGGNPGYRNRVSLNIPPLPGSAWRSQPDGTGPTVEMLMKLANGRALSAQEESALSTLAPLTASVRNFNRDSQLAEVVLTPEGDLSLRMRMATSHPNFAETKKRFTDAAGRVAPVRSDVGNTLRFDPDALRQPGALERIRIETEGNIREITPEQSDRESLLMLIDHLPMGYARLQYDRAWANHMTNGIIVEVIIASLSDRDPGSLHFRMRTKMYCDAQGNLRQDVNAPEEGRILIRNWATTMRATPGVGVALLSTLDTQTSGMIDNAFNAESLGKVLEATSRTTRMRRLTETERNADLNRRAFDIQVGEVFVQTETRLMNRIASFQTMLGQPDGMSFWDHVSENFIMSMSPAALITFELARAAGIENPLDVRPSTAMRQIRKRTQEALKVNEGLLKKLRNDFNRTGTPRQQIAFVESVHTDMADLNFDDINRRMEYCRTACNVMETGLGYADIAGQTFAERVPILGPLLYSSLRNGVGMLAGEQIRNPDGSYRPRDWGDFGVDVAISAIPMGSRIPGLRQLGSMGIRTMIRRLGTNATRQILRATLEQGKDMLKTQLQQIMQKVRDGKSWEEIWDETMAQEGDELIVSFFIGTAARLVASVAGDQAGKVIGDYASRNVRMLRPQMQQLSKATTKMIRERMQKLSVKQLEGPVHELIDDIVDHHPVPQTPGPPSAS